MPRLFEIAEHQQWPLVVVDRDGQPVLLLRRGAVVSDELVEALNQLIGDDYYEPGRHDIAAWLHDFIARCVPEAPPGSRPQAGQIRTQD